MTATVKQRRTAQRVRLALVGMIGTIGVISSAAALPPLNNSGLTPEQCYQKDSECTQFCGEVTGDLRYECFSICDRMLDNCLTTGDWDDSPLKVDPGTCRPHDANVGALSSLLLQMVMVLGDEDKDGRLPPKEIQSLKERVGKVGVSAAKKKPTTPEHK